MQKRAPMRPTLLCLALLWSLAEADSPAQFNYRAQHNQAASKAIGKNGKSEQSKASGSIQEPPRVRESYLQQLNEPERWAQYVPETAGSIEAEISEARREARELDQKKAQEQRADELQQKLSKQEQDVIKTANDPEQSKASSRKRSGSPLKRAIQKMKSSTKKAERRALARLEHFLDLDDDDDDDHNGDIDGDDDHSDELVRDGKGNVKYRASKRQSREKGPGLLSRSWNLIRSIFVLCYVASRWSSKNLLWIPSTYVGEAVRWSAHTSWKTTRWTSERALVGPALTATAPVLYLAEGLLFLFVYTPGKLLALVIREFYPVYIYLGAALAVGTAMGIASAIILYIGSFFLSDTSLVEEGASRQADQIPEDLAKRYKQRRKSSSSSKWVKKGESIIERAIQESLQRDKRRNNVGRDRQALAAESDEEDDYFGQGISSTAKGKGRSNSNGNDITPTGSMRRAPNHFGPPSLPLGATGQGGWSSSNSSPAMSPVTVRSNIPPLSSFSYTSARSKPQVSPLVSPDVILSGSSRQRRNVNTSL